MEDFTPLPQESPLPYFNVGKLKVVVNCSVFSYHQTPKQKLQWLQLTFGFLKVKFVWVRKIMFGCKKRCWKFIPFNMKFWSSECHTEANSGTKCSLFEKCRKNIHLMCRNLHSYLFVKAGRLPFLFILCRSRTKIRGCHYTRIFCLH